jgi:hypothetical protein
MGVECDAVFEVPTVVNTDEWEYGPPNVPVLVSATETIRVLLGTLDTEEAAKPDLFIERRRNGWMIAIHPTNGDPCGIVYIFDDGRSFLVPEGIRVIDGHTDSVGEEIDAVVSH